MSRNDRTIDMINGPMLTNIVQFAIPVMLAAMLEMVFNAADTIIVGKFSGQHALAAVGATGSIVFFLTSLFGGLSSGVNVVVAKYIGRRDEDMIRKSVHTSYLTAVVGGILLTIAGVIAAKPLLELMKTPEDIIGLSALYLRIFWLSSVFMMIYNFGSAILRSNGDTRRPFHYLAFAGVLNVVLNIFFVVVLKMSVAGVAIATVISQAVSAVLITNALLHEEGFMKLEMKHLHFDREMLSEIIRIGVPAGLQGTVFSISNLVIQSRINALGSVIVAGNSAAVNIEDFVYIGMIGFSQACITFTSQNVGAGRYDQIKKIMWLTLALNIISGYVVGLIIRLNGTFFLSLYTNDAAVVDAGLYRLKYVTYWLFLNGVMDIFVCSMRGMGQSTLPTLLSLAGICGLRLLYIAIFCREGSSLATLYFCFPLSWVVTSVIQFVLWVMVYRDTCIV